VSKINFSFDPLGFTEACANAYVAEYAAGLTEEHAAELERVLYSCITRGAMRIIDVSQFKDASERVKAHQAGIADMKANLKPTETSAILYIGESGGDTPSAGFYFGYHEDNASTHFAIFFLRNDGALQLTDCGAILEGNKLCFTRGTPDPLMGQFLSGAYAMFRASYLEDIAVKSTDVLGFM
jgi:hypothetical protein